MWKVRYLTPDGDLAETEFSGTLAELAAAFDEQTVVVVQRPMPIAMRAPTEDAAEGTDAMSIEKR